MVVYLAGNPNCGKTTLFNRLTGAKEAVGNRAGVTVALTARRMRELDAKLVDLPGVVSLDEAGEDGEEGVARKAIALGKPDLILNLADANALERSLLLTMQLAELGIPMVLALTMLDEAEDRGLFIDAQALSDELGVCVIPICAKDGRGIAELTEALRTTDLSKPRRFPAEGREARFRRIERITARVVRGGRAPSTLMDRILTHRIWGFPIFFLVMGLVFTLTFDGPGAWLTKGMERLMDLLSPTALLGGLPAPLYSFLMDGLYAGIGGVLSFLPAITLLFLLLSLLEDSGYLARVAFLTDTLFRRLGLNGLACVPLLLGFGCTVPAAMSCRTLHASSDRDRTLSLLSFVPCSARLPVLGLIASRLFAEKRGLVVLLAYLLSLVTGCIVCAVGAKKRSSKAPFALELPPWRVPILKNVLNVLSARVGHFLSRAGSVILIGSTLLWALWHFNAQFQFQLVREGSLMLLIGDVLAPLFRPLGFGFPTAVIALLAGLFAKELIVSALLVAPEAVGLALFTPASAFAFLLFCVLYPPCLAAQAVYARELSRPAKLLYILLRQLILAYLLSALAYHLLLLFL